MANNQNGYDPNWHPCNSNWQAPSSSQVNTYWSYGVPMGQQTSQVVMPGIPGKIIQDMKEIRPNDVPMDGSTAYYPVADGQVIIAKRWTGNGTIQTDRYILDTPAPASAPSEENQNGSQYQQILDELGAIKKALYRKPPYHKNNFNSNKMKQEAKTHGE